MSDDRVRTHRGEPSDHASRPRLVIAEDHSMVAQGLRAMLAEDHEVVAVVEDGKEVVAAVGRHRPDVLLLDLSLPGRTGMDILTDLRDIAPGIRVIVVTMHVEPVMVDAAVGLGAAGFVPKDAGVAELRTAIAEVMDGRRYVSPRVKRRGHRGSEFDHLGFSRLTPRQQDIVRMIGRGLTSDQMASELGLTLYTVRFHRKSIMRQLGMENEWALVRYAILIGMADEPDPA